MAGFWETCLRVLRDQLATAHHPTVPPTGERAVIVIIARAVTLVDHLCSKQGTRPNRPQIKLQGIASSSNQYRFLSYSANFGWVSFQRKGPTELGTLNAIDQRYGTRPAAFALRLPPRCGLIAVMAILKKRDHQTEFRLLLESGEPVDLPPAEVSEDAVLIQFGKLRPYVPELIDALRAGTLAEPVAVMNDGSTFAIHGETRTFWVKLWHTAGSDLTKIERVQVISCLPSTRGTNVIIGDESQD
jgi:hypothetical protein